jgi:hypothetical protein
MLGAVQSNTMRGKQLYHRPDGRAGRLHQIGPDTGSDLVIIPRKF